MKASGLASSGTRGASRARLALFVAAMLLVPFAGVVLALVWSPLHPLPLVPSASVPLPTVPTAVTPAADLIPEIRGHILDAEGNPVNGANVRLVSPSPPYAVYRDTRTDRAGAFSFPHVGPWKARVAADHDPDGVVTSAVLQAAEGQSTEITLVLSAAGAVRGTVVDSEDKPVAGAVLSVEGMPWIVPAVTSDAAGAFRLVIVPHEATALVAVAQGYRTAHAVLGPRDDETELVVRVRLTAAAPVDGEVRDPDGNPVRAQIVACEEQPSEARTESAEDGTFQLPPSAIGCEAVAEHRELGPSDAVPVAEGRRVVLRLKAGGAIDGVVVDEHGSGFESFTLGIESFTPSRGRGFGGSGPRSFENLRGSFLWEKLAPGTYVLTASVPDRPPARSGPIDVTSGVVSRGVRIVVDRGGTVMGRVVDEHGGPLKGVDLHFDAVSSVVDSKASAQTDGGGKYRLEGAPAGPFTLRVHKDGFRMKLVSGLRVASGSTLQQEVVLMAMDGGPGLELGGIGATVEQTRDGIALHDVFPTDPAGRAGLRAGDRIQRIDGETTDGMSLADVLQRLRGEAGTTVGISARRPETGETVEINVVRGTIVH